MGGAATGDIAPGFGPKGQGAFDVGATGAGCTRSLNHEGPAPAVDGSLLGGAGCSARMNGKAASAGRGGGDDGRDGCC